MKIGDKFEIEVGGRRVVCTNPGVRAVLKAQEECMLPNGQISLLRYVEYIGARWTEGFQPT